MTTEIVIRKMRELDQAFIFELSPTLAEVAGLTWHSDSSVQKMQDNYITEVLDKTAVPQVTFIAEKNNVRLGFIHVCAHTDSISGETCGTVPLLAVSPATQSMGVGKILMTAAEIWAQEQGYRLLHLEVFANNTKAHSFYKNLGFEDETLHMIKEV